MTLNLSSIHNAIKTGTCRLPTLPPSAQAFLGYQLSQSQLWITDSFQTLEKLSDSFRTFFGSRKKKLLIFQGLENQDMQIMGESLNTLRFLERRPSEPFVLLTLFQCLEQKLPDIGKPILLKTGDEYPPDQIFQSLENLGYTLDVEVYEKGRAARRCGIIDLWPPTEENPIRLEFFGDEIDNLRTFDPATQCSIEKISSLEILPLNAQGNIPLEELLPPDTLRIFSNVDAVSPPRSLRPQRSGDTASTIEIGCVTTDAIGIDLAPYYTNLKPVSELQRPDMAETQRNQFFHSLIGMVSKRWEIDDRVFDAQRNQRFLRRS